MKQFTIIFGLILLLLSSACGGQKKSSTLPAQPDMSAFRGKATDKIYCRLDSNNSYALYLPSTYKTEKRWPVIIAFDSHGDGRLPVSLMKEEAEKYGYLIVGSNNSKNGLSTDVTSAIYDVVIRDVKWRFAVDTQRIYTMGFSGGARVAAYQGLYKSGIRGVIGCSAGLPSNANPSGASFDYLGVVGTDDFNYLEMKQLFKSLDQTSLPHWLLTFEGTHAWPPKATIGDIFSYLQISGMKGGIVPRDTAWISALGKSLTARVEADKKRGNWIKALEISGMGTYYFKGLPEETIFNTLGQQIRSRKEVAASLQQQENWLTKENGLQQEYLQYLGNKNSEWWKGEVQKVNTICEQKKGNEEAHVYKRLLSYLSLASYMNANQALNTKQWDAFRYFVTVYALVDPENSETAYLQAVLDMKDKQGDRTINSLKKAVKLGFNDLNRLEKDTSFVGIQDKKEFIDLCNALKTNK